MNYKFTKESSTIEFLEAFAQKENISPEKIRQIKFILIGLEGFETCDDLTYLDSSIWKGINLELVYFSKLRQFLTHCSLSSPPLIPFTKPPLQDINPFYEEPKKLLEKTLKIWKSLNQKKKIFYITTAIAYPNGPPHMGHALEILQADALSRFYRKMGFKVIFQTGTDEHGKKNWQKAQELGITVHQLLDQNVFVFRKLFEQLQISNDRFFRTSTPDHYKGSQKIWLEIDKAKDFYKKNYTALYCVGCESFKVPNDLEEGVCPNHSNSKLESISEENWFFTLSKYSKQLTEIIESQRYYVHPESRKTELLAFLANSKDVSFSRPKDVLPWGVPVPTDDQHVMYVWCDALSNYITGSGYGTNEEKYEKEWPPDIHIVGKDIVKFHAAFWPGMLLSANLPLPRELFIHGFLLSNGQKMGKSLGNVIDPFAQLEKWGVNEFRFYTLACSSLEGDGDYTEKMLEERINGELVGKLSNFLYRSVSLAKKALGGKIVPLDNSVADINKDLYARFENVRDAYLKRDFRSAINEILTISHIGNIYLQEKEPWKKPENGPQSLSWAVNLAKNIAIAVEPIMPNFSERLLQQLGLQGKNFLWTDINWSLGHHQIGEPEILVKRTYSLNPDNNPDAFRKKAEKQAAAKEVKQKKNKNEKPSNKKDDQKQQLPDEKQKVLIIMRGLPGSGKSTKSRSLCPKDEKGECIPGHIFSTDDFFEQTGKYLFDPKKLTKAHEWNQERTKQALKNGISPIIIDNTNTQKWEARPYIEVGLKYGYTIEITEPETEWKTNAQELVKHNQHNVPLVAIESMLRRWETDFTIEKILKATRK